MTTKSHVSLEQAQCPICLTLHDTGTVLLHKRLAPALDPKTVTHQSPCPSCASRLKDFVALIACDPSTIVERDGLVTNHTTLTRTGEICWLKHAAFARTFNIPIPANGICYCEPDVVALLKARSTPPAQPAD